MKPHRPPAAMPALWLLLFFLLPLAIIVVISLAESIDARPPFTPVLSYSAEAGLAIDARLENYRTLIGDELYVVAFIDSLRIAATAAVICLAIGFPMTLAIARAPAPWRGPLLMLVVLPFWTSFLIRVYAWMALLRPTGVINNALIATGLAAEPLPLINNEFAIHLGIVYSYLPFMILPLYAALEKIDPELLDAAADLGCRKLATLVHVIVPLAMPGIAAGLLLVFIPAAGEFVIPDLLGGPDTLMIGRVLWTEFFTNRDWPVAAALAVAMVIVLAVPILLLQHFGAEAREPNR